MIYILELPDKEECLVWENERNGSYAVRCICKNFDHTEILKKEIDATRGRVQEKINCDGCKK